jgi:hypothetical protein
MVLVGLLRWHACMLRELSSGDLLYKSYRFALDENQIWMVKGCSDP